MLIFSETTQHLICILLIKDLMELKLNVKILFFQFTVLIKYFRVFYLINKIHTTNATFYYTNIETSIYYTNIEIELC